MKKSFDITQTWLVCINCGYKTELIGKGNFAVRGVVTFMISIIIFLSEPNPCNSMKECSTQGCLPQPV